MEECCAYCYTTTEKLFRCGQCQKRLYCSKDCQRLDWKKCHHKHFCKVGVGEFGVDWEVKESPESGGLGVFALRTISKDEIIMMERPLLKCPTPLSPDGSYRPLERDIPTTARDAVASLYPPHGSLADKFRQNGMPVSDHDDKAGAQTGLFIRMSRVNHHCIGNATTCFLPNRNAMILVASHTIEPGEEITFPYLPPLANERGKTLLWIQLRYGFDCRCQACTDPDLAADLARMKELDEAILEALQDVGNVEKSKVTMQKGKALLDLFDKHGMSSGMYSRTYCGLYKLAMARRETRKLGVVYITNAYESALSYVSDASNEGVMQMKRIVDSTN